VSASHFFINEFFAAPDRGLPFLPMAFSAHPDPAAAPPLASASHFFIDEVLAAPDRGFPALLTALDSQSDAAVATWANSILAANRQAIILDMVVVPLIMDYGWLTETFYIRCRKNPMRLMPSHSGAIMINMKNKSENSTTSPKPREGLIVEGPIPWVRKPVVDVDPKNLRFVMDLNRESDPRSMMIMRGISKEDLERFDQAESKKIGLLEILGDRMGELADIPALQTDCPQTSKTEAQSASPDEK
jgi:hypothetical protein